MGSLRQKAGKRRLVRGEEVVRKVLRATVEELAAVGYRGLRMEDVARRAGVNKTSVYRRWPTKDELVRAALLSMLEMGLTFVAPDTGSLRGDLLALARMAREGIRSTEGKAFLRMLLAEGADPVVMSIARSIQQAREAVPRSIMESAIERGELPRDVDVGLVIEVIRAVARDRLFIQGKRVDDAFMNRLIDLLLHGALSSSYRNKLLQ